MCSCLWSAPLLRTWPATPGCALSGNRTSDPLVLRPALNALSHTNQENFALCDSMVDLENIMLSEISQSEEDKYHMILLLCGI